MTGGSTARPKQRAVLGAKVSAILQRWPSRNHFAELAPRSSDEPHPVDMMLEREPHLQKVARRAARMFAKVQERANPAHLLEFEAERTFLDTARVEVAFNLGFENGLVLGRAQGLRHGGRCPNDTSERELLAALRAALAATRASPRRTVLLLLELAWALARDPHAERRRARDKVPVRAAKWRTD